MQWPTLSNAKPKYRQLVSQSQSPFLIPATWLLSDLYPTSLYYCDHSHPTRGSLGTTRMPVDTFSIVVWLLVHGLDYGLDLTVPVSSTISCVCHLSITSPWAFCCPIHLSAPLEIRCLTKEQYKVQLR